MIAHVRKECKQDEVLQIASGGTGQSVVMCSGPQIPTDRQIIVHYAAEYAVVAMRYAGR